MSGPAALPPLSDEDWPEEIRDLLPGFSGRLNVYRVMAHHPRLLRAWQQFRDHVVLETSLGRERSEVVILRTGHRLDAPYEWAHHVVRGRACGLADDRIARLAGPLEAIEGSDRVLATAVDELLEAGRLSAGTRAALTETVGREGVLDLMATIGLYSTLAYIVNSFDTPLDADVAAELAARPAP